MMRRLSIAVGYASKEAKPEILYIGADNAEALKALEDAGTERRILFGGVLRNPMFSKRRDFAHIMTVEEQAKAEKDAQALDAKSQAEAEEKAHVARRQAALDAVKVLGLTPEEFERRMNASDELAVKSRALEALTTEHAAAKEALAKVTTDHENAQQDLIAANAKLAEIKTPENNGVEKDATAPTNSAPSSDSTQAPKPDASGKSAAAATAPKKK